jgi:hypothetical protein
MEVIRKVLKLMSFLLMTQVHKKTKQSKNKHFTDVYENISPCDLLFLWWNLLFLWWISNQNKNISPLKIEM